MFDRIRLWNHLLLGFCLLEVFKSQSQFQCLWLVCLYFLFLPGSVFEGCAFLSIWGWLVYIPHVIEIRQYLSFSVWLTSLSMIISGSIHVAANGIILFFFYGWVVFIVYIYHIFFIHSFVDRHFGYLSVLAIVNSAAVSIGVHVSFQIRVFSGYMPRSGIVGSYTT